MNDDPSLPSREEHLEMLRGMVKELRADQRQFPWILGLKQAADRLEDVIRTYEEVLPDPPDGAARGDGCP